MYSKQELNNMIYPHDFAKMSKSLMDAASKFKRQLMKAKLRHEDIDRRDVTTFISAATAYAKFWADYGENIQSILPKSKGSPKAYGISYDLVREYLHSTNDYASILQYTDGVWKGVNVGKFIKADQIMDFYEHTVNQAFRHYGNSPANVIENVINAFDVDCSEVGDQESKYFNDMRHTRVYEQRDRIEMNKAINATIEFLRQDFNSSKNEMVGDIQLHVAMTYSVIDYAIHTLFVYAARMYAIGRYVWPFMKYTMSDQTSPMGESFKESADLYYSMMQETDEIMVRDVNRFDDFARIMTRWLVDLNCIPAGEDAYGVYPSYNRTGSDKDNPFVKAMYANPLYTFIADNGILIDNYTHKDQIEMLRKKIQGFMLSTTHGIETMDTPRQSVLLTIRNVNPEHETVDEYRSLGKGLYYVGMRMLSQLRYMIDSFANWRNSGTNLKEATPTLTAATAECMRILAEFYRDLAVAVLHKARDIEQHINHINGAQEDKIRKELMIKVPGMKNDINSGDNMMSIVPDTTRSVGIMESMYIDSNLAILEAYDMYAQSLPGMENDPYFTEAVDLSKIINSILAKIKSWGDRYRAFLQNRAVLKGFQWMIAHKNEIESMTFENVEMQVLPYKTKLQRPAGFDNMISKIQSATIENFKTPEAKDAFIRGLYPSDVIASWFMDPYENIRKQAPMKYRNHILFNDINSVKEVDPQPVTITGNTISQDIKSVWIPNIESAPKALQEHREISDRFTRAIDELKRKIANNVGGTANTTTTVNTNPPAIPNASITGSNGNKATTTTATSTAAGSQNQKAGNSGTATESQNQANANDHGTNISVEAAIGEISQVIENVWGSMTNMFIEYDRAMYGYLQEAYSKGTKH